MRRLISLFLALCSTATLWAASDLPGLSAAEQEVVDTSKARLEAAATRDTVAWVRFVADDCLFSDDNGVLLTKTQMLEHYKKLPAAFDRALDPREYVVHLYHKTAVVNYRATVHEQFGLTDIVIEQRRTETFVKQNGSWLLVAIQWDNLPINLRKPAARGTRPYQDYVGQYQWRSGDDVETILVVKGKLISQVGEQMDEYLPAGGDQFFLRDDTGSYTFIRDREGHVTGYLYQRTDGQTIHAQKIK